MLLMAAQLKDAKVPGTCRRVPEIGIGCAIQTLRAQGTPCVVLEPAHLLYASMPDNSKLPVSATSHSDGMKTEVELAISRMCN